MKLLRINGGRILVVGLLLLATLIAADRPAAADHTEGGPGIWLVTIPDNDAGWAILNGSGQWVAPECRQEIEDLGGFFEIVEWPTIAETDEPSHVLDCGEIQDLYFAPDGDSTTPDVPTVTSPSNRDVVSQLAVRGRASDDVGVVRVQLQMVATNGESTFGDAVLANPGGLSTTYTYSPDLAPDTYNVLVRAWDEAGNRSVWHRTWNVTVIDPNDAVAPTARIASPVRLSTVNEIVITGDASDNVGVAKVQVRIVNGDNSIKLWASAELENRDGRNTSYSFTAPSLPDGEYRLSVRGIDAADNRGPWAWSRVVLDTGGDGESPGEHLARILANPTRNTSFDDLDYADTPMSQIPLGALTLDYDPYRENLLDTSVSAYFRVKCEISHFSYDDPIVFPNQPNRTHLHMFFGNTKANAYSDFDSMLNTGSGSCNGENLNRTGYWVPALLDTEGNALIPFEVMVYYKNDNFRSGGANELVDPFPDNLRIIVGDATANEPQTAPTGRPGSLPAVSFNCGRAYGDNVLEPVIPDGCYANGEGQYARALEMKIAFPQCFDPASGTYASDGSHLSYAEGGYYGTFCPPSHPVDLSSIMYRIFFSPNDYPDINFDELVLSSDVRANTVLPGGTTVHGDWFGAWHPDAMREWVANCNNTLADCETGLLNRSPVLALRPRQRGFYEPGHLAPVGELMQLCPQKTFDPNAPLHSVATCQAHN